MADAFSKILGQPLVRDFLRKSAKSGHFSQSYLFLGPAGSNKTQAAFALACAYLCENEEALGGQCGKCDVCKKILSRKHPDVKFYSPEGQNGYLISQIREIIHDSELAPIQSNKKVYIIDRVDVLSSAPANAFLKTLEEPTKNTCMILLGRCANAVLPTIVSRCICVPFRYIPQKEAVAIITQNTGFDEEKSKIALSSCGNSISSAISMLRYHDNKMMLIRNKICEEIFGVVGTNDWEVIKSAKRILELIKTPSDEYRTKLEQELTESEEFLSKVGKKTLEISNRRGLKRQEIKMLNMVLDIEISILHDILMCICARKSECVNVDYIEKIERISNNTTLSDIVPSIENVGALKNQIAYNVSAESIVDLALFLVIKGVEKL